MTPGDHQRMLVNALNLKEAELDQFIYRIMPAEYLYDLFHTNENTLARPRKWQDPFENFILRSPAVLNGEDIHWDFADDFFGQCWTLHRASDAMWQIYSPTKESIRVRTTIRKAWNALAAFAGDKASYQAYIGKVRYLSNPKLMAFAHSAISMPLNAHDFATTLLVKRPAFKHEREIRLLFFADRRQTLGGSDLFRYPVDPHTMIDQLMVDPRLTTAEANQFMSTIRAKTQYAGRILRSLLYTLPKGFKFEINAG